MNVELMTSFFDVSDFEALFPYEATNQLYGGFDQLKMAVAAMPAFLDSSFDKDEELDWKRAQN